MFSERSYARNTDDYGRQTTSVLVWMLCAIGAGFLIQIIFERLLPAGSQMFPLQAAALGPYAISQGHVWTLVSYVFLHDTGNFLHILGNTLTIYFMGREVLPLLGQKRFAWFCAAAALGGGLFWLAVNFNRPGALLIGASSISLALVVLFACFYPNNKITLLVFFIIPLSIRPKYVAIAAAVIDLCGFLLSELPGKHGAFSVAYSAHLGGMMVAVLYYFVIHRREWRAPDTRGGSVFPEWMRRKPKTPPPAVAAPKYKVNFTSRDDLRAEVDRILDKINSQGFASLTDEEKQILDSAKDMISGR